MNTEFPLSLFFSLGLCSPFCSLSSMKSRNCRPVYIEINQAWVGGGWSVTGGLLHENEEQQGWVGTVPFTSLIL